MDETTLRSAVETAFGKMSDRHFSTDLGINPALPIQIRSFREIEGWRSLLLLTPWMLARLLFPPETAELELPPQWNPKSASTDEFELLGPIVEFFLLGSKQKAHPVHIAELGTFLVQPLILNMLPFSKPEEVYEAWNRVILTRDENRKRLNVRSQWHEDVSRREFFSRMAQKTE